MSPTQLPSAQRSQGSGNRRQQQPPQNPNRGSQGPAKLAKEAGACGCGQHLCSSAAQLTSLPHPPESSFLCCGQQRSRSHPLRDGGSAPGRPHRELRAQRAPRSAWGGRAGPVWGLPRRQRRQPRRPSAGRRRDPTGAAQAAPRSRPRLGTAARGCSPAARPRRRGAQRGKPGVPARQRGAHSPARRVPCFRPRPTARRT